MSFTLYDDKLSMVSLQRVKQVPRSANRIWIRLLDLDRVSPRSKTTTGMPVNRSSHLSVCDALPRYKLANDSQTNTCCRSKETKRWYNTYTCILAKSTHSFAYLRLQTPEKRFELFPFHLAHWLQTRFVAVFRTIATFIARRGRGVCLSRRR